MATEPEDPILDAEEEGGPVKGFLEHLEDLRWVLLKCVTALFVSLLICLLAAPVLVGILKRPLEESSKLVALYGGDATAVAVKLGTNTVGVFKPGKEYIEKFSSTLGIKPEEKLTIDLYPLSYGENHFLAFRLNTNQNDFPQKAPVELLNLSPASGFMVALQVAFYGGLVFASPFILFFVAQFVLPALKVNELRYVRKAFLFSIGLFLAGLSLCYFILLPIALRAAVWFSNQMGFGAFQWTADTYISFVTKFLLAMGIGFELPIFLLLFVKLGLLSYSTLASNRKIIFVVILIASAILTPPDVVTQIAMTIPLYGLFEITALIAWWWERKEKKRKEAEEAAEAAEREALRIKRNRQIAAENRKKRAAAKKAEEEKLASLTIEGKAEQANREEESLDAIIPTEENLNPAVVSDPNQIYSQVADIKENDFKKDQADTDKIESKQEFVPEGPLNPPYVPEGIEESEGEISLSEESESNDNAFTERARNKEKQVSILTPSQNIPMSEDLKIDATGKALEFEDSQNPSYITDAAYHPYAEAIKNSAINEDNFSNLSQEIEKESQPILLEATKKENDLQKEEKESLSEQLAVGLNEKQEKDPILEKGTTLEKERIKRVFRDFDTNTDIPL